VLRVVREFEQSRAGLEPATSLLQVGRPKYYATTPHFGSQRLDYKKLIRSPRRVSSSHVWLSHLLSGDEIAKRDLMIHAG